ncbi:hypothetical protein PRZ48_003915 [Zasmidium cellare]|uniref:Uncharacterized protein n=1 Tax=Zasmidium cellare TaxID=395010 RepID=A0ABR0EXZ9_ZASCE|nr:hypothetical protein PRZ48_003915 [Zasmidium cellare]
MTDPAYAEREHKAQEARFEEWIKDPRDQTNTAVPPLPVPTRCVGFIGRDGQEGVEVDTRAELGPHQGYYPGGNDAEEVVEMENVPELFLSDHQRAERAEIPSSPPSQPPGRPEPTPALLNFVQAAFLKPPPSTQPTARMPLYATMRNLEDFYSAARPPANVQPPLNVDLGLVEICTFMPDWLLVPELLVRLMRNGADASMLAKIELSAINKLTQPNLNKRRGSHDARMEKHGKACFGVPENQVWNNAYAQAAGPENDLTANSWTNPTSEAWGSWKLESIYSIVPKENWPKGKDRLLFTQCLEYAAMFPGKDLDTAHIPWIVEKLRLGQPALPASGNRDQAAVKRFGIADPSE